MGRLSVKRHMMIISILLILVLTACDVSEVGSLIEVENQEEQFAKMTKELSNMKEIKVKSIPTERYKKMRDIIYDNYFMHKSEEDKKYITEEAYEAGNGSTCYDLRYEKGKTYENLFYRAGYLRWDAGNNVSDGSVIEEVPDLKIVEQEVEKLFQLLDLPLGDSENGYVIDDLSASEDNRASATIKRYIEGKGLSTWEVTSPDLENVETIYINFTGNTLSEINMEGLSEVVSVEPLKEDILVNTPQKAHKIIDDYIRSMSSSYIVTEDGIVKKKEEKEVLDIAQIAYVVQSQEDDISILHPMAEFHCNPSVGGYHIDLATKEVIRG